MRHSWLTKIVLLCYNQLVVFFLSSLEAIDVPGTQYRNTRKTTLPLDEFPTRFFS